MPDGIAPIKDATGRTTGFRDNIGNAIDVTFDESGNATGLKTTDRQGGAPGDNGFSTVRTTIDIAGGPISATSAIAIGDPPVEPKSQGEIGHLVGNAIRPALDNDGNLIGFRDASIDEQGFGRELTFTTDANGDIDGYRVTDYATFSQIAGVDPSLSVAGFTDFDLAGNVLARALA